MNVRPTAAIGFPWLDHGTVAETDRRFEIGIRQVQQIRRLDRISRYRELTYRESRQLERLVYGSGQR